MNIEIRRCSEGCRNSIQTTATIGIGGIVVVVAAALMVHGAAPHPLHTRHEGHVLAVAMHEAPHKAPSAPTNVLIEQAYTCADGLCVSTCCAPPVDHGGRPWQTCVSPCPQVLPPGWTRIDDGPPSSYIYQMMP